MGEAVMIDEAGYIYIANEDHETLGFFSSIEKIEEENPSMWVEEYVEEYNRNVAGETWRQGWLYS